MSGNPRIRRTGRVLFTALAAGLAILAGTLLMHRLQLESVQSIRQGIHDWRPVLTGIRLTVILLVTLGWNRLITLLVRMEMIHSARAVQLTALRARCVLWMVVLEGVLGQGVLVRAVQLATGTAS